MTPTDRYVRELRELHAYADELLERNRGRRRRALPPWLWPLVAVAVYVLVVVLTEGAP